MGKITVSGNGQRMVEVNQNRMQRRAEKQIGTERKQEQRTTVYAADLNLVQDSILAKKQKAQQEAMELLQNVFKADLKSEEELMEREKHIDEMKQQNKDAKSKLKDIEGMRENLTEHYGISENSEEHQDLELLRKGEAAKEPLSGIELTKEEEERLAKLQEQGLTDYQRISRELDAAEEEYTKKMADNERDILIEENGIKDTEMLRLKKHPMKDARMQADKLLETARKEMIGGLYKEAKDHVDEKIEEEKEKQQKRTEEKQEAEKEAVIKVARRTEQEILLQRAKENAKEAERTQMSLQEYVYSNDISKSSVNAVEAVQAEQEMQELLDKMKLLEEDLKGAAVDDII